TPDIAGDIFVLRTEADAAEIALVELPPETGRALHQVPRIGGAGRAALDPAPAVVGQRVAVAIAADAGHGPAVRMLEAGIAVQVQRRGRVPEHARHDLIPGERMRAAVRSIGHVRQLSGAVAADALADQAAELEFQLLRHDRQDHARADAAADIGLVLEIRPVAEEAGDAIDLVMAPARLPRRLGDDVRPGIVGVVDRAGIGVEQAAALGRGRVLIA